MAFPSRRAPTSFAHSFKGYGGQCGLGDSGSAAKNYRIDIPVFAGPPSTTQDAWNKQTADFSCSINGEIKKFQIKMNLANVANGLHIYPIPDAKKTEDAYFPPNTWGFAITPRNFKQFNYQLLMDALIWNKYRVDSCRLQWQPCLGSFKAGQIEAILVSDAQSMPPEPYSNQGNSYVFSATTGAGVAFNISNLQQPIKSTRSVEDTWSIAADYGILYVRADGYSDLTAITKVGTISLNIGVTLFGYSPDPKAQLIGPWIEAGYPIEGSSQTKSVGQKTASAAFVDISADNALDFNKISAKKRKRIPKGWHVIVEEGKDAMPCAGFGAVLSSESLRSNVKALKMVRGINDAEKDLIVSATTSFDFGLTGKDLIDNLGKTESSAFADQKTGILGTNPLYGGNLIIQGINNASIVFKPTGYVNAHTLSQGLISVPYSTTKGAADYVASGNSVGFTATSITAFEPTCKPPSAGGALNQVALGYSKDIGRSVTGSIADNGIFAKMLAAAAGVVINGSRNGLGAEEELNGNSAVSEGVEDEEKSIETESGKKIDAQSIKFKVPEDATVRSNIVKWDNLSVNKMVGQAFFKTLGCVADYGVKSYAINAMGPEVSRITVNGQVNTLVSAFMGIQGTTSDAVSKADIDINNNFVLVASRYSPIENADKFLETAIPITPVSEGISQGHSSTIMNNLSGDTNMSFKVQETSIEKGATLKNFSNLGAFCFGTVAFPSVVNFSMPYPDKLIEYKDEDEYELTELKAGEVFYCMVLKGSRVTFSHSVAEPTGTFRFSVSPGLIQGTDKVPADQALHQYYLTTNDQNIVTSVKEGDALNQSTYYMIDSDRRFAYQSSKPADSV